MLHQGLRLSGTERSEQRPGTAAGIDFSVDILQKTLLLMSIDVVCYNNKVSIISPRTRLHRSSPIEEEGDRPMDHGGRAPRRKDGGRGPPARLAALLAFLAACCMPFVDACPRRTCQPAAPPGLSREEVLPTYRPPQRPTYLSRRALAIIVGVIPLPPRRSIVHGGMRWSWSKRQKMY